MLNLFLCCPFSRAWIIVRPVPSRMSQRAESLLTPAAAVAADAKKGLHGVTYSNNLKGGKERSLRRTNNTSETTPKQSKSTKGQRRRRHMQASKQTNTKGLRVNRVKTTTTTTTTGTTCCNDTNTSFPSFVLFVVPHTANYRFSRSRHVCLFYF